MTGGTIQSTRRNPDNARSSFCGGSVRDPQSPIDAVGSAVIFELYACVPGIASLKRGIQLSKTSDDTWARPNVTFRERDS